MWSASPCWVTFESRARRIPATSQTQVIAYVPIEKEVASRAPRARLLAVVSASCIVLSQLCNLLPVIGLVWLATQGPVATIFESKHQMPDDGVVKAVSTQILP